MLQHAQAHSHASGGLPAPGTIMQQMRAQSGSGQNQPKAGQTLAHPPMPAQHLIIQHQQPPIQHQHQHHSFGALRSYPTSHSSTPFTSPSGSASSSPYVSPSLPSSHPSHSSASQLSLAHSSSSQASPPAAHVEGGGLLAVSSKVQIRGPESIHPKLHAYAYSFAEIVQLPVHPVTWYGVRLRDGKNVKLRKSSFDVVSAYPTTSGSTVSAGMPQQQSSSPQFSFQQPPSPQQQPQQATPYSPYQFSHYHPSQAYNPYSQQQPQSYPGATLQVPVGPSSKIVYGSPSPSPSPLPPSSSSLASSGGSATSASIATRDMAGLSVSTPQQTPATRQPPVDPMASEEEYEDLDLNASTPPAAKHSHPPESHPTRHYPAHASPSSCVSSDVDGGLEGMSDVGPTGGVTVSTHTPTSVVAHHASSLVLPGKRKPVPRALSSPEPADQDEDGETSSDREHHGGDREDEDDPQQDDEYDSEETDSYSKKLSPSGGGGGGGGKKSQKSSSLAHSKTASGPSNSGGGGGGGSNNSKSARQRRGRGRALLGLNVVITNGRYKGETGLVVRGANGYYSVQFHRAIAELRQHDNTAMKRSSELAPITPTGKRLALPLAPAQRKIMKQEALRLTHAGVMSSGVSEATTSPRLGALGGGGASKRKAGVTFREAQSPRGDRQRRRKDDPSLQQGGGDMTDGDEYEEEERMYSSGGEYDEDAPRLSRSHSSSSSRSSSPCSSRSSSQGSRSPTQTELLSPALHATYAVDGSYVSPRPSFSSQSHSYHHTPIHTSTSIPASPRQTSIMSLPPSLVLGSTSHHHHHHHSTHQLHAYSASPSKFASLLPQAAHPLGPGRASSPGVAEAAGILLEFRSVVGGPEIPGHWSLSHIKPSLAARPEQWMAGGGQTVAWTH